MRIEGACWTPSINRLLIRCQCGNLTKQSADRWKVRCYCGLEENLAAIRTRHAEEKQLEYIEERRMATKKKEKVTMELHHPEAARVICNLGDYRALRKMFEEQEKTSKEELEPILSEFEGTDIFLTPEVKLERRWNNGRATIDRLLLLEAGVSPGIIEQATRQGDGYWTYIVEQREGR